MNEKNLSLHFGAVADPLEKQIADQGLTIDKKKCKIHQKCADGLALLRIRFVITDSECHKGVQRLMKQIAKDVSTRTNASTNE